MDHEQAPRILTTYIFYLWILSLLSPLLFVIQPLFAPSHSKIFAQALHSPQNSLLPLSFLVKRSSVCVPLQSHSFGKASPSFTLAQEILFSTRINVNQKQTNNKFKNSKKEEEEQEPPYCFIVAIPIYILTSSAQGFSLLHILANICLLIFR